MFFFSISCMIVLNSSYYPRNPSQILFLKGGDERTGNVFFFRVGGGKRSVFCNQPFRKWMMNEENMNALWFRATKNQDITTGPLTCTFTHLLALLTHSLTLHCSLSSHVPLHPFILKIAHSLPSPLESEQLDGSEISFSEP